jgi:serine protease Do
MKKFIYRSVSIAAICVICSQYTMAQGPKDPPPPPPKPDDMEKPERAEIIIHQKGDKDTKLTLEIKNGDYFINGKPLEKFDDENVVVEKRNLDDIVLDIPQSAFRVNPLNEERMERMQRGNEDMARKLQKSIQIRMNAAFLGVSSKKAEKGGATVLEVTEGSPAEKAGIKKGDIITKINDTKIESPESLFETVHNYKPGDKVKVLLTRNGKEEVVTATLDKPDYKGKDYNYNYNYNYQVPPMPYLKGLEMNEDWGENRHPKIGIKAQDAEDGKGVNILEVSDSSAASKAGLLKGDIILECNGEDVNSTNELIDQLQDARQKVTIKVKIQRGGEEKEIEIRIPRKLKTAEL